MHIIEVAFGVLHTPKYVQRMFVWFEYHRMPWYNLSLVQA
jgi:hypothetical protein